MRVHELAAELGIELALLQDFLVSLGEKSNHLAKVGPNVAILARTHFVDANEMLSDAIPAENNYYADEMTPEIEDALHAAADARFGNSREPVAVVDGQPYYRPTAEENAASIARFEEDYKSRLKSLGVQFASLDGEVREIEPAPIDPDLPGAACEYESVGRANAIPLLADNGAYRGTLALDPTTAERLRAALKGRSVADATLYPERGELVAVTWPDYQKLAVRLDD